MSRTVWITNDGGHSDYGRALEVAGPGSRVRPLTVGNVNVFQPDRLVQAISEGIVRMSRSDDYLLPSGKGIVSAIAMHIWLRHHGECTLLIWHASKHLYLERVVKSKQIEEVMDQMLYRSA